MSPFLVRSARTVLLTATSWAAHTALAQAPLPDAGRTLESIERTAPQLPAIPPRLSTTPVPAIAASSNTTRIAIQSIVFEGVSVFSSAQMQALVEDAMGKSLTLAELGALAARITQFYRINDYLVARAYLPAQDIVGGKVTIAVTEGRIGSVNLSNTSDVRADVVAGFLKPLQNGNIVQQGPIARSMLLLSDLPGVAVQTTLAPGAEIGTTQINVNTTPAGRVDGRIELDNGGNRYTGIARVSGLININNPLGRGDQLGLRVLSSGPLLNYARLSYALPINSSGTRLAVNYALSRYAVGAEFASLQASGDARVAGAALTHPLVRSEAFNLRGEASFTSKTLNDRIQSTATESQKTARQLTLGISTDWRDSWLGSAGATAASLSLGQGRLGLSSQAAAQDASTAQTAGNFSKVNWSATRWQQLGRSSSVYINASGQQARGNLDSSEKFALGGSAGVRAYPEGEAAGDSASLLNAELRFDPLPANRYTPQVMAFYDEGRTQLNTTLWAGFTGRNSRTLAGYGAGLTWEKSPNWRLQLLYAKPAGSELATTDTRQGARAWLRMVWLYP